MRVIMPTTVFVRFFFLPSLLNRGFGQACGSADCALRSGKREAHCPAGSGTEMEYRVEGRGPDFHSLGSSQSLCVLHSIRLARSRNELPIAVGPEHSWVQHRIHIRLIMRQSWTE